MPDDRIYDAINVFKYSPTGQLAANIGGDARYRARYQRLITDVLAMLWSLWSQEEIGFADLVGVIGNSAVRFGHDIRVNSLLQPSPKMTTYSTVVEQGKLAAVSCNIVHEATHLVRHISSYPEEEIVCRTLQLFYFRDLRSGVRYHSRVGGGPLVARFTPTTLFYADYLSRLNRLASHDLVDAVFDIAEYRRDLEEAETANFISRSLAWWGGLDNRWPSTKGYYLRSLAAQRDGDYAPKILEILESVQPSRWQAVKSCAGDFQLILDGLRQGHHIYNIPFLRRIQAVQESLGDSFGFDAH